MKEQITFWFAKLPYEQRKCLNQVISVLGSGQNHGSTWELCHDLKNLGEKYNQRAQKANRQNAEQDEEWLRIVAEINANEAAEKAKAK